MDDGVLGHSSLRRQKLEIVILRSSTGSPSTCGTITRADANSQRGDRSLLGVLSGLAADGFKIILERLHAVCADDLPDPILELRDEFLSDREHLEAAFGGLHELCSPVGWIGHTYDVAVGLEVLDQFGHGLLGHLRAFGQNADRRPRVVQVLKDRSVRRAYRAVAALGQPDDDEVVEGDERLPHQRGEVEGPLVAPAYRDTS
jgi:hypothetical protein